MRGSFGKEGGGTLAICVFRRDGNGGLAPGALFGAWGMGALSESLLEKYWTAATVAGVATALLAAGGAISVARSAKRLRIAEDLDMLGIGSRGSLGRRV